MAYQVGRCGRGSGGGRSGFTPLVPLPGLFSDGLPGGAMRPGTWGVACDWHSRSNAEKIAGRRFAQLYRANPVGARTRLHRVRSPGRSAIFSDAFGFAFLLVQWRVFRNAKLCAP